ncbi:AAA family ATPase [Streptomyces sp. NPDC005483]|uniref:helix-turn-helix transcriptional regulator n=1 Tax=Streptomyces sp. NPDC005483 TaxID=3154882 RepID=UPI0033A09D7B
MGRELFGRESETARLDLLIASVSDHGEALLLRAGAGLGKSALLHYAADRAQERGLRVLRATGAESETDLAFAGLHQLLRPVMDRLDTLVEAQRTAIAQALGLSTERSGTDRFLISVAALNLLSEAAPVLVVVDDAQWLDPSSADVLRFVARRLADEQIGLLIAERSGHPDTFGVSELPELRVPPLSDAASAQMLAAAVTVPLSASVRDRLLGEAAGNPLALTELHLSLSGAELSGAVPLSDRPFWSTRLTTLFIHGVQQLPPPSRALLLLAAAGEALRLDELLRAGRALDATAADLEAVEAAGLASVHDGALVFRHPLIRSAVYQSARFVERQRAHQALGDILAEDPDRSVLHRAAAAAGKDEPTAAALVAVAERAQARGGPAEAAAALVRAAALSPDKQAAAARQAQAAEMARLSGRLSWARNLAEEVSADPTDKQLQGQLAYTLAAIHNESGELVAAARTLLHSAPDTVDPPMAALMLSRAAFFAWNAADRPLLAEVCGRLREVEVSPWLNAAAVLDGRQAPPDQAPPEELPVWLRLLVTYSAWIQGVRGWTASTATQMVAELRSSGSAGELLVGLEVLAESEAELGRVESARLAADEGLRLAQDLGGDLHASIFRSIVALQAARAGDRARAEEMAHSAFAWAAARRIGSVAARATWALGLLELSGGDVKGAYHHLSRLISPTDVAAHPSIAARAVADLAEAAVRADATGGLSADLLASGTALSLRARALLTPGQDAFGLALEAAEQAGAPFEIARTRLAFGEWLRLERRGKEARPQLRGALDAFEALGASGWVERARNALRSVGESAPVHRSSLATLLTPQELQVATLAARGLSNKEIGAQLFLSPRTVGYHLYRLFPKIGIASRAELRDLDLLG